jgi:hypothetical protein
LKVALRVETTKKAPTSRTSRKRESGSRKTSINTRCTMSPAMCERLGPSSPRATANMRGAKTRHSSSAAPGRPLRKPVKIAASVSNENACPPPPSACGSRVCGHDSKSQLVETNSLHTGAHHSPTSLSEHHPQRRVSAFLRAVCPRFGCMPRAFSLLWRKCRVLFCLRSRP